MDTKELEKCSICGCYTDSILTFGSPLGVDKLRGCYDCLKNHAVPYSYLLEKMSKVDKNYNNLNQQYKDYCIGICKYLEIDIKKFITDLKSFKAK